MSGAIPLLPLYALVDSGLEDGTDKWYRNVGKKNYHSTLCNTLEERRSYLPFKFSCTVDGTNVDVGRVAN